ncbi:MAG: PAS domain-containing protein [Thermoplasmatota archaeon]
MVPKPERPPIARILESRRLLRDARSLLDDGWRARGASAAPQASDAHTSPARSESGARAVIVHAITVDADGESHVRGDADRATRASPILVMLADTPAIPEFLPPEEASPPSQAPVRKEIAEAFERHVGAALHPSPPVEDALDLVESIQDAILMIDRRSLILYANTSAISLLQSLTSRTGPFVAQPLANAFVPAATVTLRPALDAALHHAETARIEDPERHRGRAFDVAIFPNPRGATLLIRDITGRKDTEAELREVRIALRRATAELAMGERTEPR